MNRGANRTARRGLDGIRARAWAKFGFTAPRKSSVLLTAALAVLLLWVLYMDTARAQVPVAAEGYRRLYVRTVSAEWGIGAPIASLAAQVAQESGFDCRAVSRVGARGCAQFMPATARWIEDLNPTLAGFAGGLAFDPYTSFRAQAIYMKWIRERIRADNECERIAFALQAYNGGLKRVLARQARSRTPGRCFDAACNINPGILASNQKEAQEYPVRIERHWAPRFKAAGWGRTAC